jgi:hypothetical protein
MMRSNPSLNPNAQKAARPLATALASKMDNLKIKLMHKEAVGRLHDANILSKNAGRETDSNYLLELLAFELLLKAAALIHAGKYRKTHNYQQLFESLPGPTREKILNRSFH